jgi:hypothetical protein
VKDLVSLVQLHVHLSLVVERLIQLVPAEVVDVQVGLVEAAV